MPRETSNPSDRDPSSRSGPMSCEDSVPRNLGEFIIDEGNKTLPLPFDLKHAFCGLSRLLLNSTSQSGSEVKGSEVAQSCPTLSDPMDCSLPGSSVHGVFQARVLEWGAIAFSNFPAAMVTPESTTGTP